MEALALTLKQAMEKSLAALRTNFSTLRTNRASASLLDKIQVDYYGTKTPLNQVATISIPEPRQILIKPFSKDDCKAIAAAISASDLGVTPVNDGTSVRLTLPMLTEDRRRELAKVAKKMAEDAKIAVRNVRKDHLSKVTKELYSEDLKKRIEDDMAKVTDEVMKAIDQAYAAKEKEILSL